MPIHPLLIPTPTHPPTHNPPHKASSSTPFRPPPFRTPLRPSVHVGMAASDHHHPRPYHDDDDDDEDQPRLPPALRTPFPLLLEGIPEFIFASVAVYFTAGEPEKEYRKLSLVSKTLLNHYGGALKALDLQWQPDNRVLALVSLVRQQHRLLKLIARSPRAAHALTAIIPAQGCFRQLRELSVAVAVDGLAAFEQVQEMAGAFAQPGVLPTLEILCLRPLAPWRQGMLPLLAGAFGSGAAPHLRILDLWHAPQGTSDVEALAAMLEGRAALLPPCGGLERLMAPSLLDPRRRPEALRCRLLRALLPSVTDLGEMLTWCGAYEFIFAEVVAHRLRTVKMRGARGARVPSQRTWEAMPALEDVDHHCGHVNEALNAGPVVAALSGGVAFQHVHSLCLGDLVLGPKDWSSLLHALAYSTCAQQLTSLELGGSNLCPASMQAFSGLVGLDRFPLLQKLLFMYSDGIGDDGVAALAQGLSVAPRTRLTHLDLDSVGMGDRAMAALAGVVGTGCFNHLQDLFADGSNTVTDAGLYAFQNAAKEHGLRVRCKAASAKYIPFAIVGWPGGG